jgi:hypothetical protein
VMTGTACPGSLACTGGGAGGVYQSDVASLIWRGLVILAAVKAGTERWEDVVTKAVDLIGRHTASKTIRKEGRRSHRLCLCLVSSVTLMLSL